MYKKLVNVDTLKINMQSRALHIAASLQCKNCFHFFPQVLDALKEIYKTVDDIDLYIGCLAESTKCFKKATKCFKKATTRADGDLMGPTGLCVIAQQFALTKNNDRFFYDVGSQSSSFNLGK